MDVERTQTAANGGRPGADRKMALALRLCSAAAVFLATYLVVYKLASRVGDYTYHYSLAADFSWGNLGASLRENPYALWHILVRLCLGLGMSGPMASAAVSAGLNTWAFLLADRFSARYDSARDLLTYFMLLSVMFIGPLYVPFFNPSYCLGQVDPNVWHNPTTFAVKPIAIICFFAILDYLRDVGEGGKIAPRRYAWLAAVLLLSVFAKPSFFQGFVPALGVYLLIRCCREHFRHIKEYFLLCLTFVPGVLLVFYQFLFYFGSESTRSGVGVSWLKVLSYYTPNIWISMLLTLAFPLLYFALDGKRLFRCPDVQLSSIWFVVSMAEAMLLYETDEYYTYHGNFTWAAIVAMFAVWCVLTFHFLRDLRDMRERHDSRDRKKAAALILAYLAHLVSGGLYYLQLLFTYMDY